MKHFIAVLAMASLCGVAFAQQGRGTIQGSVTDSSGASVQGVAIRVTNTSTNLSFVTETNGEGYYSAPNLNVGPYVVTGEKTGFRKAIRSGLVLQVDQRAQVDLRLEVGQVAETVEVKGDAALVDAGSSTVGKVIENRRVVELPLNGRSALALTLLTPSVKSNAGPTNSGFGDRGIQLSSISINGGPNSMNGQLLDGSNNIQSYIGEVAINPGVDAVEEFKVQSGALPAEFGFTAGGVINMVTKSGTNQLHGSVYEFFRNDVLDARNTFAATKPPFRYNQFGAAAGGKIIKDRTFFFANWERYYYRRATALIGTYPTANQRTGNFSDLLDTAGRLIPIYDPATTGTNAAGQATRDIFGGNVIPASRFDPVASKINDFYPLPNRTPTNLFTNANNYGRLAGEARFMQQFTVKGDHRFSDRNSMFGRYSFFNHQTDNGTGINPNDVVTKRDDNLKNWNVVLSDTHVFTPTLINEARLGVTRGYFPFIVRSFGGDWPAKLGLPSIVPSDTFPGISNGLPGFNTGTAGIRGSVNWQFLDTVTLIRGGHSIKLGIDFRTLQGNNLQRAQPSGQYNFAAGLTGNPNTPAGTGSAYASFLLGAVSSASVTTHLGESQRSHTISGFIQDDWKITRTFTVNLGLRYDVQAQTVENRNGTTNFDLNCRLPNGLFGCTIYAGVDGQPRSFRNEDYSNLGPRIGFAWDVFNNSRTVLRAGYGLIYPSQMWRENYGNAAGFAQTSTQYPQTNPNLPAFQLRQGFPSAPIQPLGRALGAAPFLGQNPAIDEKDGNMPRSNQMSISLQQQLKGNLLIDASYSGNVGSGFTSGSYDFNQLDPKLLVEGANLRQQVANPYAGLVSGALGGATISRLQSLRPYPYYNGISIRNPRLGAYNSHLFLLSVEKRMSKGLTVMFSFTGGKVISDSLASPVNFGSIEQANQISFQDGKYNRKLERSVDPTDVSKRAVISLLYELPFGKGSNAIVSKFIGGWQVNTIGIMQTGLPVIIGGANNFLATRPNSTGTSAKLSNPTAQRWFDTDQFINPTDYTYGTIGRALPDVRGPGTFNWDLSLIKNTRFMERFNLQFRAEAFNFLNSVNLGLPNGSFSAGANGRNQSGAFGTITSARDARNVQLGLKLIF
jgi:hypothetical protein